MQRTRAPLADEGSIDTMEGVPVYYCEGCRTFRPGTHRGPQRIEVHTCRDSDETIADYYFCPDCCQKLSKGQPIYPYG